MATNANNSGTARTAEGYEVSSADLAQFAAKRNLSQSEAIEAIALLSYGVFCTHLDLY